MPLPTRKPNRIPDYDYSQPGVYFVTICTAGRETILSRILFDRSSHRLMQNRPDLRRGDHWSPASPLSPPIVELSQVGHIAEDAIRQIHNCYENVSIDCFVIMPNHLHLLVRIKETGKSLEKGGRPMVAPTVSRVIQQLKGHVTKQVGFQIWQKGFHDHIIRNGEDYRRIRQYILCNPANWEADCFYVPDPATT